MGFCNPNYTSVLLILLRLNELLTFGQDWQEGNNLDCKSCNHGIR